ncbi:MAG: AMP-binding protein, partial [Nocardioidaceae bacterium]
MHTAQRTLPGVLRAAASRYVDREAVVDGETRLTYTELHERVRRTAAALIALGVEKGDRVCIWAPNSWQWEVLALAVTYAGGTLTPVNTRYTGHEAAEVISRTGAKAVAVADGFLGRSQCDELASAASERGLTIPAVVRLPYGGSSAG